MKQLHGIMINDTLARLREFGMRYEVGFDIDAANDFWVRRVDGAWDKTAIQASVDDVSGAKTYHSNEFGSTTFVSNTNGKKLGVGMDTDDGSQLFGRLKTSASDETTLGARFIFNDYSTSIVMNTIGTKSQAFDFKYVPIMSGYRYEGIGFGMQSSTGGRDSRSVALTGDGMTVSSKLGSSSTSVRNIKILTNEWTNSDKAGFLFREEAGIRSTKFGVKGKLVATEAIDEADLDSYITMRQLTSTVGIAEVVAGTGVTVDNTDPLRPIVSSTSAGSTGALGSINVSDSATGWMNSGWYAITDGGVGAITSLDAYFKTAGGNTYIGNLTGDTYVGDLGDDVYLGKQGNDTVMVSALLPLAPTLPAHAARLSDVTSASTTDRDRANHTGTQLSSTISDIQTTITNNASVLANTAKVTNATHTGDVTGATALTIANNVVTLAKMADVATSTVFYRKTASTGDPEVQTLATLKTDLGLTGTNSGDQTITLTGNVTGSGTGSFATTIATNAVDNSKLSQVATTTIKGRNTAGTGNVEDLSVSTVKTMLNLTGTNSGDQTSIVGITGTKAQFNTAVTDGDILYVGDVTTNATHTGDVTGATALTIANDVVSNAKLANMATATIKGRTTAGTGDPEDLTATQARTVIDVYSKTETTNITNNKQPYHGVYHDGTNYESDLIYDEVTGELYFSAPTTIYDQTGVKYTIPTTPMFDTTGLASGIYFVSMNSAGGISGSTTTWNQLIVSPIAIIVHKNGGISKAFDERHRHYRNAAATNAAHYSEGTILRTKPIIAGFTLNGTTDASNSYSLSSVVVQDEDISMNTRTKTEIQTLSQIQVDAVGDIAFVSTNAHGYNVGTTYPTKQVTTVGGGIAEIIPVINGTYFNMYLLAGTFLDESYRYFLASGYQQWNKPNASDTLALSNAISALVGNDCPVFKKLNLQEVNTFLKLTYFVKSSNTQIGKAQLVSVQEIIGNRQQNLSTTVPGTTPDLQLVTDTGATTTNVITTGGYIDTALTSGNVVIGGGATKLTSLSRSGIDTNAVNLTTDQSVAGVKTFSKMSVWQYTDSLGDRALNIRPDVAVGSNLPLGGINFWANNTMTVNRRSRVEAFTTSFGNQIGLRVITHNTEAAGDITALTITPAGALLDVMSTAAKTALADNAILANFGDVKSIGDIRYQPLATDLTNFSSWFDIVDISTTIKALQGNTTSTIFNGVGATILTSNHAKNGSIWNVRASAGYATDLTMPLTDANNGAIMYMYGTGIAGSGLDSSTAPKLYFRRDGSIRDTVSTETKLATSGFETTLTNFNDLNSLGLYNPTILTTGTSTLTFTNGFTYRIFGRLSLLADTNLLSFNNSIYFAKITESFSISTPSTPLVTTGSQDWTSNNLNCESGQYFVDISITYNTNNNMIQVQGTVTGINSTGRVSDRFWGDKKQGAGVMPTQVIIDVGSYTNSKLHIQRVQ